MVGRFEVGGKYGLNETTEKPGKKRPQNAIP
jgi:hypothetical protein